MRARRRVIGLLAVLSVCALRPAPCRADDDPAALNRQVEDLKKRVRELEALVTKLGGTLPGAPAAAPDARAAALRVRAGEWLKARMQLPRVQCPTCRGVGAVVVAANVQQACPRCEARRTIVPKEPFRVVHYDMKTEAWRRAHTQAEANASYRNADTTGSTPLMLRKGRLDRVEVVGARFGRAWVFEENDSVSRESRWVLATDSSAKKENWFVFSEDTDGPWEEPPAAPAAPPQQLGAEELAALRGRVALVETRLSLEGAGMVGPALVARFVDPKAGDASTLDAGLDASAYQLARAAAEGLADVAEVRLVLLARWRDKFGGVEVRPYRALSISREALARVKPENLSREELLSIFSEQRASYDDSIMWWKP